MRIYRIIFYCLLLICSTTKAQQDSTVDVLEEIPVKYLSDIKHKVDKYSKQISSKTERTLQKLSNWEEKIRTIIDKIDPSISARLFGKGQHTFASVLEKIKAGQMTLDHYNVKYDAYRDKLTTDLKFLTVQKENLDPGLLLPLTTTSATLTRLNVQLDEADAIEEFIVQRKKELINSTIKYIGQNRYLQKINKEAWYFIESMRNYKTLFSEPGQTELLVKKLLNQIPAFEKFARQNSFLAALFATPGNYGNAASLTGLQTLADVQMQIADRMIAGPGASATISQNLREAHNKIGDLKQRLLKAGGSNSDDLNELNFKPNNQKTKTFCQRIEYELNYQFSRPNNLKPSMIHIAVGAGYKLNDRSIIGIGGSYILGFGTLKNLRFSHEGIGIRSFIDWKLRGSIYMFGGFEMNHDASFTTIPALKEYNAWQQSGLVGLSKKLPVKSKWLKGAKLQLLFDMLAGTHMPETPPLLLRVGYTF